MSKGEQILDVRNIHMRFNSKGICVRAVTDVSFPVYEGETIGIVGESGCGKTTLGRCIVRAYEPSEGSVMYTTSGGKVIDFLKIDKQTMKKYRKEIQMIFQDPYSSLDPRMTVLNIISEPLICHHLMGPAERREYVKELMVTVGLNPRHLERYPHAFSGGQRQRIGIARALATKPRFVVCDEAVAALDVSVQAQVLNLLMDLQEKMNLSYLFISHDLGVVSHISDRVGVMYVGHMVELADTVKLFARPMHPYTEALLSAKPVADPRNKSRRIMLEGDVANPAHLPSGCPFHPRCRYAKDICKEQLPEWRELEPGHYVACHCAQDLQLHGMRGYEK